MMNKINFWARLILISFQLILVMAWPSGAPEKVCDSLQPSHGNNQPRSPGDTPFVITQSHSTYQPGDRIKVVVQAPQGVSFKGLMVQAYDPSTQQPLGIFQPGRGLKAMDSCSAVTHTDRRPKRSALLVWEAPAQAVPGSQIAFRGTLVQRFSDFYTGMNSILAKA